MVLKTRGGAESGEGRAGHVLMCPGKHLQPTLNVLGGLGAREWPGSIYIFKMPLAALWRGRAPG